ncbi:MFS transporter [Pseudomonas sp. NPDC088368]|uniref:MFS transporter n=1 Tax=Pseudomonas sp. NPDC088368 TaxID=3364453 RepID=UPI0038151DE7
MVIDVLPEKKQQMILIVIALVSSLVMLDSNVVAVALPTIAVSLNADFSDVQWVITAYVLPFAALLLAAGSFGDKVGRRRSAVIGMTLFGVSSLACGLAISPLMLNLARAVQGVGASLLLTASLAIINHTFEGHARAKAYAFWGASLGVAITCGPIIGGVISSMFGWTWAFLINVPICAVLVIATLKIVPESSDPHAKGLDYGGILSFSSGLFLLTWAVIDGNALGWFAPAVLWRFIGGASLLVLFVFVERCQANPMVDFAIFRSAHFGGTVASMVGYAAGAQVMIFYLPLYLQNAFGFSPMAAGISMLPFALPMFLVPRLGAKLTWPPRSVLSLGLAVTFTGNALMALTSNASVSYGLFAIAMVIAGTGAGILNGETAKAVQGALPSNRSGVASGIASTIRFTTLLFGVAALGAVLASTMLRVFVPAGQQAGLPMDVAVDLAKRFSAGDAESQLAALPGQMREVIATSLRTAFEFSFSSAAWVAATIALLALVLTRILMVKTAPVVPQPEALFVADE